MSFQEVMGVMGVVVAITLVISFLMCTILLSRKFRLPDEEVENSYTNIILYLIDKNKLWYPNGQKNDYQKVSISREKIELIKEEIVKKLKLKSNKELEMFEYFAKELEKELTRSLLKEISVNDIIKNSVVLTVLASYWKILIEPVVNFFRESTDVADLTIGIIVAAITLIYTISLIIGIVIEYKKHQNSVISKELKYKTVLIAIDELKAELNESK